MTGEKSRRPPPLSLLLVGINLCLLGLLLYTAWTGTETARLLGTPPKPFPPPQLKLQPPAPGATLASIREAPLFYASRHFYTPPQPSALPAAPPKPDYKLVGTFVIPSKPTVALLANSSGIARKVKPGDDLEGWTVQVVESGRVVLQYQTLTFEISSNSKNGAAGIRMVPVSRTAQLATLGDASIPGGIRKLGGQGAERSPARGASSVASPPLRFYRPPPQ